MFLKKKYITCDECKKEVKPGKGILGSNILGFVDKEGNTINICEECIIRAGKGEKLKVLEKYN